MDAECNMHVPFIFVFSSLICGDARANVHLVQCSRLNALGVGNKMRIRIESLESSVTNEVTTGDSNKREQNRKKKSCEQSTATTSQCQNGCIQFGNRNPFWRVWMGQRKKNVTRQTDATATRKKTNELNLSTILVKFFFLSTFWRAVGRAISREELEFTVSKIECIQWQRQRTLGKWFYVYSPEPERRRAKISATTNRNRSLVFACMYAGWMLWNRGQGWPDTCMHIYVCLFLLLPVTDW